MKTSPDKLCCRLSRRRASFVPLRDEELSTQLPPFDYRSSRCIHADETNRATHFIATTRAVSDRGVVRHTFRPPQTRCVALRHAHWMLLRARIAFLPHEKIVNFVRERCQEGASESAKSVSKFAALGGSRRPAPQRGVTRSLAARLEQLLPTTVGKRWQLRDDRDVEAAVDRPSPGRTRRRPR